MSGRSFRSVFMVASCAGAALGCYLVSLRVASERAALEDVETQIVMAQRDIRLLQTEIGTRGRLAQLERWNAKVIALSAPTADQFLKGGFELARLTTPERKAPIEAPVILASAPAPVPDAPAAPKEGAQSKASGGAAAMLHVASLKTQPRAQKDTGLSPREPMLADPKRRPPAAKETLTASAKSTAAKTAPAKIQPKPAAAKEASIKPGPSQKKSAVAKAPPLKPATAKPTGNAARDPLAPLAEPKPKTVAASKIKTSKDSARKQ
jgi:hypothetical protein